jgi:glycine cleavage system H protein
LGYLGSLKYTESHEWISDEGDKVVKVGISKYAQDQLGEIVYCDLPSTGKVFRKGQTLCTLESVKAVGEVYCPVDGEVIEVNEELSSQPSLVNQDPESEGWLLKLKYTTGSFDAISKAFKDPVSYKDFLAKQSGH